jgi:hypothetical protein
VGDDWLGPVLTMLEGSIELQWSPKELQRAAIGAK